MASNHPRISAICRSLSPSPKKTYHQYDHWGLCLPIRARRFFLRGELAIFGGTFDVFAGIFQGLPEGLLWIFFKNNLWKNNLRSRVFFKKSKKLWWLTENPEKFSGRARKIRKIFFKRDRDCDRKFSITGCGVG